MTDDHHMSRLLILLLCWVGLTSCTQLRTEFYRNETAYLYETGCERYKQGAYDEAEEVLEELISLDPDYGPAYAVLGNLAMLEEQYEQAYDYYQQAITHDPELENDVLPFLLISSMQKIRRPLTDSGIDLAVIYALLMDGQNDEVEALLAQDVALDLLARDSVSLTPGQLGELRRTCVELRGALHNYPRLQLFSAYLLFYGGEDISVAAELLLAMMTTAAGAQKQEAAVLMGRVQEKQGNYGAAVQWYLTAVEAGVALETVAHRLAKIYQVDLETVLPPETAANAETGDTAAEADTVHQASSLSSSRKPAIPSAEDETEFMLPKPSAVLLPSPQ